MNYIIIINFIVLVRYWSNDLNQAEKRYSIEPMQPKKDD